MARDATLKLADPTEITDPTGDAVGAVRAAAAHSRRNLLAALRDRIASEIDDGVPARDLASLSKRLLDISAELEDLEAAEDTDHVGTAATTPDESWGGR